MTIHFLSACIFDGKTYRKKLRARYLGCFLNHIIVNKFLEIGISDSWKTMNPSKEMFTGRWWILKNVKTLKPPR